MSRKPNISCTTCKKFFYKRPSRLQRDKRHFCSWECYQKRVRHKPKICPICKKSFIPGNSKQVCCSRTCANKKRYGISYKKGGFSNNTEHRFWKLKQSCKFKSCMIKGCNYKKTYNIHRLISGKQGGRYKIGNMFAICPNHHAEIHARIIKVAKINDCKLKILED